jgi:hypothetical protein
MSNVTPLRPLEPDPRNGFVYASESYETQYGNDIETEASRRPQVVEGVLVDTLEICPPLSLREIAEIGKLRAIAEQRLAPAAAEAREAFIDEQTEKLVKRTGMSKRDAGRVIECQIGGRLLPELELPFDDEGLAGKTVADVLKDPAKFVGATLADPLEGVGYGTCKAKIMRRADGTLWINSFAHGRTTYDLKLDARTIRAAKATLADHPERAGIGGID